MQDDYFLRSCETQCRSVLLRGDKLKLAETQTLRDETHRYSF